MKNRAAADRQRHLRCTLLVLSAATLAMAWPHATQALPASDASNDAHARIYLPYAWQGAAAQLEVERQHGGASEAIAVQGDLAFVGAGPRVLVFDHSEADRGILREIGQSPLLPGIVRDIALDADGSGQASRAVVALGEAGVAVLDLSDPTRPRIVGSSAATGSIATGSIATELIDQLVLQGDFAYAGGSRAIAIDLRQPSAPRIEGAFGANRRCGGYRSLVLRVGQLWSLECHQLVVYALDDPGHPRPLRSIDLEALLRDVLPGLLVLNMYSFALDGEILWLAFSSNAHARIGIHLARLAEIDLAARPSPSLKSEHRLGLPGGNQDAYCSAPESLNVSDGQIFVRCGRRLMIVDRMQVVDPSEIESLAVNPWRFVLDDGRIHYADGDGGYGLITADPAGHWIERAEILWPGHIREMAKVGGRLFVAGCALGPQFGQDYELCQSPSSADNANAENGRGAYGFAMDDSDTLAPVSLPDLPVLDIGSLGDLLLTVDQFGISLHEPRADGGLGLRERAPLPPAWQRKLAIGEGQITVVDGSPPPDPAARLVPVHRFDVIEPTALQYRGAGQLNLGGFGGFEPSAALIAGGDLLVTGAGLTMDSPLLPGLSPPQVWRSAPNLYRISLASLEQNLPLLPAQLLVAEPSILAAGPGRVVLAARPGLLLFDIDDGGRLDVSTPSHQVTIRGSRISALGFAGDDPVAATEDGVLYRIDLQHFPTAVALPIGRVVGRPVSMLFGAGRLWVATAEGGFYGLGDRTRD